MGFSLGVKYDRTSDQVPVKVSPWKGLSGCGEPGGLSAGEKPGTAGARGESGRASRLARGVRDLRRGVLRGLRAVAQGSPRRGVYRRRALRGLGFQPGAHPWRPRRATRAENIPPEKPREPLPATPGEPSPWCTQIHRRSSISPAQAVRRPLRRRSKARSSPFYTLVAPGLGAAAPRDTNLSFVGVQPPQPPHLGRAVEDVPGPGQGVPGPHDLGRWPRCEAVRRFSRYHSSMSNPAQPLQAWTPGSTWMR